MVIKIIDCDGPAAWGVHFKDNSSLSFVFYFPVTVQIGLNIGVVLFIITEALFFLAIFFYIIWSYAIKYIKWVYIQYYVFRINFLHIRVITISLYYSILRIRIGIAFIESQVL